MLTSKGINLNTSVLVIHKNDYNIYSTKPKKTYDPYLLSLKSLFYIALHVSQN